MTEKRLRILGAMRRNPTGWDGIEVLEFLKSWGFVADDPKDYHWYVCHREKECWDLDMNLPTSTPVSRKFVVDAVELVDELLRRTESDSMEEGP